MWRNDDRAAEQRVDGRRICHHDRAILAEDKEMLGKGSFTVDGFLSLWPEEAFVFVEDQTSCPLQSDQHRMLCHDKYACALAVALSMSMPCKMQA